MLAERIQRLHDRGVPTEAFDAQIDALQNTKDGKIHGDAKCDPIQGSTKVVQIIPRDTHDACECVLDVLPARTYMALDLGERLLEHLETLESAGGEDDLEAYKAARHARNELKQELEHGMRPPKALEGLTAEVLDRLDQRVEAVAAALQSETNRERILHLAALRALTSEETQHLTPEEGMRLTGNDHCQISVLETLCREAYADARHAGGRREAREGAVLGVILADEPEHTLETFNHPAATPITPGENIITWLRGEWAHKAREAAHKLTQHWDETLENLLEESRGSKTLLLARSGYYQQPWKQDGVLAYHAQTYPGAVAVKAPGLVTEMLKQNLGREVLETLDVTGETEETIEIALGLYDETSKELNTLENALTAARTVTS